MVSRETNPPLQNWILIDLCQDYHRNVVYATCYKSREVSMRRFGMLAVSSAAMLMLCGAQDAFAQKKLSYEQAMAKCREDTYGYRLKKADRQNF
jgi:hypothetical protein